MAYLPLVASALFATLFLVPARGQLQGLAIPYRELDEGRLTSSGEWYNPNDWTAAHISLPLGTRVSVTRTDDGRHIAVRINDRGPFTPGRILALSRVAAMALGVRKNSPTKVRIVVLPPLQVSDTLRKDTLPRPVIPFFQPGSNPSSVPTWKKNPDTTQRPTLPVSKPLPLQEGIYRLQLEGFREKGYAVQIGTYRNIEGMWQELSRLHNRWFRQVMFRVDALPEGGFQYKLMLGPQATREKAIAYRSSLLEKYGIEGFVVSLNP